MSLIKIAMNTKQTAIFNKLKDMRKSMGAHVIGPIDETYKAMADKAFYDPGNTGNPMRMAAKYLKARIPKNIGK